MKKIMKTWLITGCSSGIGRGIAKAVLKKGDNAIVTARNVANVEDLVKEYPHTAFAVSLDVTNKESITKAVKLGQEKFGSIDVLINNAGYGYRSSIEEGDEDDVNVLFDTNFFGPIALIKEVLPQMRANKDGAIVSISSIAAVRSGIGSGYYAASKAALELMSDGLIKELKPLGIKAMIVEPGSFRTKFYSTSLQGTENKIDDYAETAWKTRKENVVDNQNQPGDPDKAGQVIVDVIESDNYPKRLLLGSDAVKIVSEDLEERMQEIRDWETTSSKSDF
jgi:NAD(P)-dependent dehydrogenase (short-subunit alcohol dehydrogenase family)